MTEKQKWGHVRFLTQGGGFFSLYFFVLSMVIDCYNRGLKPYIDLRRTSFVEDYNPYSDPIPVNPDNPWDWWFEQEQPPQGEILEEVEYSIKNFALDKQVWKRSDIPFARMLADKYMQIKPHILKRVDNYYNEFMKGKVILGVMARGCEFNNYHPQFGKHSVDSWVDAIHGIKVTHGDINSIFLVTEDSTYTPVICNTFPETLYLKDVFRRTNETMSYMISCPLWPSIANPREHHCQLLGEECLIQALLLGRCDYMLVKLCGTSAGAVFLANENLKDVYYLT